jgi:hypothetical protein
MTLVLVRLLLVGRGIAGSGTDEHDCQRASPEYLCQVHECTPFRLIVESHLAIVFFSISNARKRQTARLCFLCGEILEKRRV